MPATATSSRTGRPAGSAAATSPPDVGGERGELRAVPAGRRADGARRGGPRRPASRRGSPSATSSVEPPPMSTTSSPSGERVAVAPAKVQPGLLVAAEDRAVAARCGPPARPRSRRRRRRRAPPRSSPPARARRPAPRSSPRSAPPRRARAPARPAAAARRPPGRRRAGSRATRGRPRGAHPAGRRRRRAAASSWSRCPRRRSAFRRVTVYGRAPCTGCSSSRRAPAALLIGASAAQAATKNGITPTAPKKGATVARRHLPDVQGQGQRQGHRVDPRLQEARRRTAKGSSATRR